MADLEIEYETKTIPIDENYPAELAKLQEEGWNVVQGIQPVAIFHVVRNKSAQKRVPLSGGIGVINIEESKVYLKKADGTLLDKDGNQVG